MRSIQSTGRAAPEQRRVRRTWRRQRATDGGAARRSHGPVPARLTRDENNPMCDRRDANLCDRIRTGDTIDGCPLPYLLTMSLYTLRTLRGSTVVRTRHGPGTVALRSTDYTTRRFSLSLRRAARRRVHGKRKGRSLQDGRAPLHAGASTSPLTFPTDAHSTDARPFRLRYR